MLHQSKSDPTASSETNRGSILELLSPMRKMQAYHQSKLDLGYAALIAGSYQEKAKVTKYGAVKCSLLRRN
jgi:hypothetical protein